MKDNTIKDLEAAVEEDAKLINEKLYNRWYDEDLMLSEFIKRIEKSDEKSREKLAMQIIKIIINTNIESGKFKNIYEIVSSLRTGFKDSRRGRWYDIDPTVRTAMGMLKECNKKLRDKVVLQVKKFIISEIEK